MKHKEIHRESSTKKKNSEKIERERERERETEKNIFLIERIAKYKA